jgi:hypothetical protein
MGRSSDPEDRALGAKVEAFVRGMPQPDTQRLALALARELRSVNSSLSRDESARGRDRSR